MLTLRNTQTGMSSAYLVD